MVSSSEKDVLVPEIGKNSADRYLHCLEMPEAHLRSQPTSPENGRWRFRSRHAFKNGISAINDLMLNLTLVNAIGCEGSEFIFFTTRECCGILPQAFTLVAGKDVQSRLSCLGFEDVAPCSLACGAVAGRGV